MHDEEPPGWDGLPADALMEVFAALSDTGSRAACRATCRRWREVADECHSIWGACSLRRQRRPPPSAEHSGAAAPGGASSSAQAAGTPSAQPASGPIPLPSACQLLARQRPHLRQLHVDMGSVAPGPGVENPAAALAAALEAACGPGSGLTDVSLALSGALPRCVAQALPGSAAQLTALTIRPLLGGSSPAVAWQDLAHLQSLKSLVLTSDLSRAGRSAAGLGQLSSLTRLRLRGSRHRSDAAATAVAAAGAGLPDVGPALLSCPATLQRLELSAVQLRCLLPIGGGGIGRLGLVGAAVEPEGQQAVPAAAAAAAAGLGAGQAGPGPGPGPAAPAAATSRNGASVRILGWGEALESQWRCLEALRLHDVDAPSLVLKAACFSSLHDCMGAVLPRLPRLTSLHLAPRKFGKGAIELAQQCSNLQELVLGRFEDYHLPPLPAGALWQLTRLRISGSQALMKLHASWCSLPNLLSFELESCEQLLHLPLEVSTFGKLERLTFSHQRMEGLPWMVTGLSQLTRLAVAACSLEELAPGPYLRGLRELVLFANNLRSVPAVLVHPEWGALSLRRLDLSSNYSHHLSDADVAVLCQLSFLEHLNLRRQLYSAGDEHPASQLGALRDALPRCEVLS